MAATIRRLHMMQVHTIACTCILKQNELYCLCSVSPVQSKAGIVLPIYPGGFFSNEHLSSAQLTAQYEVELTLIVERQNSIRPVKKYDNNSNLRVFHQEMC